MKDSKLKTNMTIEEAVKRFIGSPEAPAIMEQMDKFLGDPGDPNSPLLKMALKTLIISPPTDMVTMVGLGKVLVEMGVCLGYLMFSPDVEPGPWGVQERGLGHDN